jgi:hypothetical protein
MCGFRTMIPFSLVTSRLVKPAAVWAWQVVMITRRWGRGALSAPSACFTCSQPVYVVGVVLGWHPEPGTPNWRTHQLNAQPGPGALVIANLRKIAENSADRRQ